MHKPASKTQSNWLWLSLVAPLVMVFSLGVVGRAQSDSLAAIEQRRATLNAIFHDYWEAKLRRSPEFASSVGDERYNDRLTDYSPEAEKAWIVRENGFLKRLEAVDASGLSDSETTSRAMLLHDLAEDEQGERFKGWEMPVNQMGGIYSSFPDMAENDSFNTVKEYDDWIRRLRAAPAAFEQVTANIRAGVREHRVPPRYLLQQTLTLVEQIAQQKPEDTPMAAPLKKFPASIPAGDKERIRRETLDVLASSVMPAYRKFAAFLKDTYIPAGREEPGIWAIPDGDEYYRFLIHRTTTTDLTVEQIHQLGLDEVKRDEEEMLAIAQKLGFQDLKSFRASLKANPKLKPASGQALIDVYQGHVNDMETKLPQLFGRLPKAKLEVVRMPEYEEKTAPPAYYNVGSPESGRPGRLLVNLYNADHRNLYNAEAISYHEGVPGHHLQFSLAQEQEGVPEFRKHAEYTAFVEGWALYSERLGKEVGFYQDPYSDFGRLDADMWRAIRLVVDTGVHAQHWTRQQMVDYFHEHSALDEPTVQSEVDRYIGWPSQALAYKAGQMKILELRERSRKALGERFDLRAFHDQVLDAGAIPLDLLDARINLWIASRK
jgi:uncharacterized protein (DUF885 family)